MRRQTYNNIHRAACAHALTPEQEANVVSAALVVLANRVSESNGESVTDPDTAGRYCQLRIGAEEREHVGVMFMDTRHRVIAWEVLFMGTIDGAEVQPREVVKAALRHNAAAVIIAHNHPSGNPEPSAADRAVTARLKAALALIDIRLLDHFVCTAAGKPVSLAARGWV